MTLTFEMRIGADKGSLEQPEYGALKNELAKLAHPACPDVDWQRVERLCLVVFTRTGADLQTICAYVLARSHLYGLEGVLEGVGVLERFLGHWSRLWPQAVATRRDLLSWLFAQLLSFIRGAGVGVSNVVHLVELERQLERIHEVVLLKTDAPLVALEMLIQHLACSVNLVDSRVNSGTLLSQRSSGLHLIPGAASVPPPVMILPSGLRPDGSVAADRPVLKNALLAAGIALFTTIASLLIWQILMGTDAHNGRSPANLFAAKSEVPERVHLPSLQLFSPGSAEVGVGDHPALVDALIEIKARPGWLIVVTGHSDNTGEAGVNRQLSLNRAVAVRNWLQRMGNISDSCFVVQGVAAQDPVADNKDADGRAANRRVDIQLLPQSEACS